MSEPGSNASLKSFADRLVDREREKREIGRDISEIKGEAKDAGLNVTALTRVVKEMLRDEEKTAKEKAIEEKVAEYKVQLKLL